MTTNAERAREIARQVLYSSYQKPFENDPIIAAIAAALDSKDAERERAVAEARETHICVRSAEGQRLEVEQARAEGFAAGREAAAEACEAMHSPADDIYKPYGRCSPECMAVDYADTVRALCTGGEKEAK